MGEEQGFDDDCRLRYRQGDLRGVEAIRSSGTGHGSTARARGALARTAVIATVPSHADDNPEHVHLFDGDRLAAMFRGAGARRVSIDHVLDHIIAVAVR